MPSSGCFAMEKNTAPAIGVCVKGAMFTDLGVTDGMPIFTEDMNMG